MTPVTPHPLPALVVRCRDALRRRAGGGAALLALATFLLVLPLAWLLAGSRGWEPGSPLPLVLLVVAGTGACLLGFRGWAKVSGWAREDRLASQIERSADLPDGAVRAQMELARFPQPGTSSSLASAGERGVLERLSRDPAILTAEGHRHARRLFRSAAALFTGVGVVVVLLWITAPERSRTAWAGLASPISTLLPGAFPPLAVTPGNAEVARGESVEIGVTAERRREVTVHWESAGALPGHRVVAVEEGRARLTLPPVESLTEYWVTAPDGADSERYRLRPLDPLIFSDIVLEVHFPPYTGLPAERHSALPDRLELPAGSRIDISGSLLGDARAVRLRAPDGSLAFETAIEDESFGVSWTPSRSGAFEWEISGEAPAGTRLPPPLAVEVVPDQPPTVRIETEGDVREFPPSLRIPLRVVARDDWGLDWVELEVIPEETPGRWGEPVLDRTGAGDRIEVALLPVLDVSEWGLAPGSSVRVRARAADGARVPAVTESNELVLTLPAADALRDHARDRVDAAAREIADLAARAGDEAEALRERAREAGQSGTGARPGEDFRSREDLRAGLEARSELTREVEELRQELARARESLSGDSQDLDLGRRMAEMERLLDEIGNEEAREQVEELLDRIRRGEEIAASEMDPERLAEWQEELRDRLEEAVDRLRRAALENAFEGAEADAGALAEAQDRVLDDIEAGAPDVAETQAAVEEQAAALEERLRDLQDRLSEAGDAEAADRAERAGDRIEQAREAMGEAASSAESGDMDRAGEQAGQASEEVRQALEELEQARMEWLEEWEDRVRDALLRGAQDALSLARIQGEVRSDLRTAAPADRSALLAREAVLLESIRNLATFLDTATRQAGAVRRDLAAVLREATEAVERAVEGLRGGSAPRAAPFAAAGQAQDALNRVAMIALQGRDQVGESPPPSEGRELADELQDMANEQEAMNQEASALSQDPGGDGASARMEELASAQEAMAGALGDLADRFGDETGDDPLRAMADESREIAAALEEGRLDADVLERQQELLDRLLEAGRSLEREGPTEEREGTTAGEFERNPVRALPPGLLHGSEIPLPSAEVLRELSPAERRLVLDYFDRLNRRGTGGVPPSSPDEDGGRP